MEGVPFNPVEIKLLGALGVPQAANTNEFDPRTLVADQTKRELAMNNLTCRIQPIELSLKHARMAGQTVRHLVCTSRWGFHS